MISLYISAAKRYVLVCAGICMADAIRPILELGLPQPSCVMSNPSESDSVRKDLENGIHPRSEHPPHRPSPQPKSEIHCLCPPDFPRHLPQSPVTTCLALTQKEPNAPDVLLPVIPAVSCPGLFWLGLIFAFKVCDSSSVFFHLPLIWVNLCFPLCRGRDFVGLW